MTFEGLGSDFDALTEAADLAAINEIPGTQPAANTPSVPAPNASAPTAQEQQPTKPAGSPPPTATPAAATSAEATSAPSSTDTAPAGIEDVLNAIQGDQGNIRERVVKSFALTSEQAAALEQDPIGTVPQLLADSYMKAVTTSLQYMQQMVPTMLTRHLAQVEQAKTAETEFFSMWPTLDRAKHGNDIRTFASAFAQANPGIDRKTLFSLVGPAVMAKYGIAMGAPTQTAQPSPQSTPAYRPAATSAPVVVQTQQLAEHPFMGLGGDYDG